MDMIFEQYGFFFLIITQLVIIIGWSLYKMRNLLSSKKILLARIRQNNCQFIEMARINFSIVNGLCEVQYEWGNNRKYKDMLAKYVDSVTVEYKPASGAVRVLYDYFSRYNTDIQKQILARPELSGSDRLLFSYLSAGFSTKTICHLLDISEDALYVRKHRLRAKLNRIDKL